MLLSTHHSEPRLIWRAPNKTRLARYLGKAFSSLGFHKSSNLSLALISRSDSWVKSLVEERLSNRDAFAAAADGMGHGGMGARGQARELHIPSHLCKSGSCVETARRVHLTVERPSVEPLLGSG